MALLKNQSDHDAPGDASPADVLRLTPEARAAAWRELVAGVEHYLTSLPDRPVGGVTDPAAIAAYLDAVDFDAPIEPAAAVNFTLRGFDRHHVHNSHPRYFGLFVPAASTMGVMADALTAAFNPVLAAWHLSPFAVALERRLVAALAARFGFDPTTSGGFFASGGSEANHSALLVALMRACPEVRAGGLRAARAAPVLYVSAEGHLSVIKAARLCGLGTESVRRVAVDADLRLDPAALARAIAEDRAAGRRPFLVVATAGTTSAGVVDPLAALAELAAREDLWLHVDAAWGGAGVLLPELAALFAGIEQADSIAFDPHKWLSVPMGAGLFLTRHPALLETTFGVDDPYMPRSAAADLYRSSMPWARRFIGLKLFLTLAVAGWQGYRAVLRHQVAMGQRLRDRLTAAGFEPVTRTPLPVVCFVDARGPAEPAHAEALVERVVRSGRAWFSTTRIGPDERLVMRGAVTSYHTTADDVDAAVAALEAARDAGTTG
ncbi:pyridoxal phosphate-dependent decarboxylase family protein [Nannocystis radixulma]|uniref:Aminotransferase class V-fold PLP-dependent enzyme n=1 Tax=Nannocystis radixulma TaxID=2995305 RepID=A0ABT5B4X6_9BACT|nr:aminotransferase class V-fold PLP-dependent enzyme [Nannocystis radixulma]MDC0669147.1 aminotransferase class V-fold PLP-dependent enzyme [Nannocystis radixulma]